MVPHYAFQKDLFWWFPSPTSLSYYFESNHHKCRSRRHGWLESPLPLRKQTPHSQLFPLFPPVFVPFCAKGIRKNIYYFFLFFLHKKDCREVLVMRHTSFVMNTWDRFLSVMLKRKMECLGKPVPIPFPTRAHWCTIQTERGKETFSCTVDINLFSALLDKALWLT